MVHSRNQYFLFSVFARVIIYYIKFIPYELKKNNNKERI